METVLIILAVAVLMLAASTAVLAAAVPFIWYKAFQLDKRVEVLDETLSTLLEAQRVPTEQIGGMRVVK